MKRLLLCLILGFTLAACWDDVDNISGEPQCVHIDFSDTNRSIAQRDGVYCAREP